VVSVDDVCRNAGLIVERFEAIARVLMQSDCHAVSLNWTATSLSYLDALRNLIQPLSLASHRPY
jgi:hypothetical protein